MLLGIILPSAICAASGDLDTSFGDGGVTRTGFANSTATARDIAIQSNGKIVVAGTIFVSTSPRAAIARYNADGTLGASFADGGKTFHNLGFTNGYASTVIQPDGKFLAAGGVRFSASSDFLVRRYNSNGTLDNSFGSAGVVTTSFGDGTSSGVSAVLLQPDGKILVVGGSSSNFAIARYNSDGSLDTTFDGDGKVTTSASADLLVTAGVLQPDGKIIAAGHSRNGNSLGFTLRRYNSNGSLDTSFGNAGSFITNIGTGNSFAFAVALEPNGKIVVSGYTDGTNDQQDFAVVRINPNGSLDRTFGTGGIVTTDVDNVTNQAGGLAIQRNGKIIIGGTSATSPRPQAVLVRYNSDGTLDNTFGQNGRAKLTDGYFYSGLAVELQPDGKIIYDGDGEADVAVYRSSNGVWYIERSRDHFAFYQFGAANDVPTPADYDGDGRADLSVFRPSNGVWYQQRSQSGLAGVQFGANEDRPLPNAFVP